VSECRLTQSPNGVYKTGIMGELSESSLNTSLLLKYLEGGTEVLSVP
jgi:hypothetical protein